MNLFRKFTTLVASLVLMAASAFPAHAVLIDFELNGPLGFADQRPLTNEYAGLGVNFTGGGEALDMSSFSFGANSGTDALAFNSSPFASARGPETILFDFAVSEVSIFGALVGSGFITMEAFDINNVFLGSTFVNSTRYSQMSLSGIGDIASLVINSTTSIWALDDLEFEAAAAVPEPATLLMLGLGFAGLLGFRRKV